jgi:zinc transporter, ZIP family
MEATALTVGLAALGTAVATGAGALPFYFTRSIGTHWIGVGNGIAAGLMAAASFALVVEGTERGSGRTALGLILGLLLVVVTSRLVNNHEFADEESGHDHEGPDAAAETHHGHAHGPVRPKSVKEGVLMVGVMTLHSFAEGVGVGVSFGEGAAFGLIVAAAIAVHNIPEGLAISLVLIPRGASVGSAAGWSIFSSLPQPLMAVPAFLFVQQFAAVLPVGLGLAAGAMLWMVTSLLSEGAEAAGSDVVGIAFVASFTAMYLIQLQLGIA